MKEVLCTLNTLRNMSNNVNYFEVRFKASFSGMPKMIFALQTDYATLLCTSKSLVSWLGINYWFPCLKPVSLTLGTMCVHA